MRKGHREYRVYRMYRIPANNTNLVCISACGINDTDKTWEPYLEIDEDIFNGSKNGREISAYIKKEFRKQMKVYSLVIPIAIFKDYMRNKKNGYYG